MGTIEQDKETLLAMGFKEVPSFVDMLSFLSEGYSVMIGDPGIPEAGIVVYKKWLSYEIGQEVNGIQRTGKVKKDQLLYIYNLAQENNQLVLAHKK